MLNTKQYINYLKSLASKKIHHLCSTSAKPTCPCRSCMYYVPMLKVCDMPSHMKALGGFCNYFDAHHRRLQTKYENTLILIEITKRSKECGLDCLKIH